MLSPLCDFQLLHCTLEILGRLLHVVLDAIEYCALFDDKPAQIPEQVRQLGYRRGNLGDLVRTLIQVDIDSRRALGLGL